MVDRKARDQMAATLRAYMAEKMRAFEFDQKITQIMGATQDKTLREIWFVLFHSYDDVKNHEVIASREIWQYFHRVLLILETDGEYQIAETRWEQNWDQRLALAAIVLYLLSLLMVRGSEIIVLILALNILSLPLLFWISRRRDARVTVRLGEKLRSAPFSSFRNVRYWRKKHPQFKRVTLTTAIKNRRLRSTMWQRVWERVSTVMFYLFFAPLIMLYFCFPQKYTRTAIVEPQTPEH